MDRRTFLLGATVASGFPIRSALGADSTGTSSRFKLYNQLHFRNMPASVTNQLDTLPVVYANQLWAGKTMSEEPDTEYIKKQFGDGKLANADKIICLDVEHWPFRRVDKQTLEKTIARYLKLLRSFKALYPDYRIGFFELAPPPLYPLFDQFGTGPVDEELLHYWERETLTLKPVFDEVGILFPQLYSRWPEAVSHWENCAKNVLIVARELAKDRPVVPFLWPQFWVDKNPIISGAYWQRMLEVVQRYADSAVLWSIYEGAPEWEPGFGWWAETQAFLQQVKP